MRGPRDRRLRAWFDSGGSLTRRLSAEFGPIRVQLLRQGAARATRAEWHALGVRGAPRAHVREVLLWAGARPLVAARSVLPAVQAGLAWRAVRGLGTRPLADLLFGSRTVVRERLGLVRCSGPRMRLLERQPVAGAASVWPKGTTWGRQARFVHRGVPLLLTEWFSPELVREGGARASPPALAGARCGTRGTRLADDTPAR